MLDQPPRRRKRGAPLGKTNTLDPRVFVYSLTDSFAPQGCARTLPTEKNSLIWRSKRIRFQLFAFSEQFNSPGKITLPAPGR